MTEEDVRLQEIDDAGDLSKTDFTPDAAILEVWELDATTEPDAAAVATIKPLMVRRRQTRRVRRWVEIIDVKNHGRVVTVIEVLSPGNKSAGRLNDDYVRKVLAYVDAGVNVVEIDLLRSSRDRLVIPTSDLRRDKQADYYAVVDRSTEPDIWQVYPMKLRSPLPAIPIPLRSKDKDVLLPLQPVVDRVYREGAHYYNDYAAKLPRRLSKTDAKWAAGLLAAWRC